MTNLSSMEMEGRAAEGKAQCSLSLSTNNRLPRFILIHEETRFLVAREQDLPFFSNNHHPGYVWVHRVGKCCNSENRCRFNGIILGDLSQI